jgi:Leucine-rich repeat (LRR) protein
MNQKEILARIAEAKANQATSLQLNHMQLTALPIEMAELIHLLEFNASGSQLTDISALASLTQLTQLTLSYNQLTDIKPLQYLTNLTCLEIEYNPIIDFTPLLKRTQLTYSKRFLFFGCEQSVTRYYANSGFFDKKTVSRILDEDFES